MSDSRESKIRVTSKLTLRGRRWYFSGSSPNAEIVVQSETYNSRESVYKGIRAACAVFGGDLDKLNIYEDGMRTSPWGK